MSGEAGEDQFLATMILPESPVSSSGKHFSQRRSYGARNPSAGFTAGGEMFSQTMVAAIDAARTLTQLDHLSTDIWKAWGSGQIGDEAQLLAMQLEARRKAVRGDLKPVGIPPGRPSIFPPRRPQRAPVRAVAIARRRHLAASGPMPPALAAGSRSASSPCCGSSATR